MSFLTDVVVVALGLLCLTCVGFGMFWIQIGHPRDWLEERLPGRLTWRVRSAYQPEADTFAFVQRSGVAEPVRSQRRSA